MNQPIPMKYFVMVLLLGVIACRRDGESRAVAVAPAAGEVVDSVIPIDSALRRFRAGLPEVPRLASGAPTRAALIGQLTAALSRSDTLGLERLAVSRAEYSWLYYPTTLISRPPYELPPALAWFQLQETNRKGALRLLRAFGGRKLELRDHSCAMAPAVEGENRIWTGCTVTLAADGGEPTSQRLFAAILERDGRFAFLSFHNDF